MWSVTFWVHLHMLLDYSFCSRSWSCLQFGAAVNSQVMCLAEVLTAVLGDVLVIDHEPFTSASEKGTFPNQCPSFGSYPVNTLLWLLHIPVGCSPNPSSHFSVLTQLVLWRDPETSLGCAGNIVTPVFICLFVYLFLYQNHQNWKEADSIMRTKRALPRTAH